MKDYFNWIGCKSSIKYKRKVHPTKELGEASEA